MIDLLIAGALALASVQTRAGQELEKGGLNMLTCDRRPMFVRMIRSPAGFTIRVDQSPQTQSVRTISFAAYDGTCTTVTAEQILAGEYVAYIGLNNHVYSGSWAPSRRAFILTMLH